MKKNLLLFSVVMLFCLFLLEVICRFFLNYNQTFSERQATSVQYTTSGYFKQNMIGDQKVFDTDKSGRPSSSLIRYSMNSLGLRGPEIPADGKSFKIIIFGGSHVFDMYSYDFSGNFGWPAEIEKQLNKTCRECMVINAGQPGMNIVDITAKASFLFEKIKPRIAILNSEWNDLKWISSGDDAFSSVSYPEKNPWLYKQNTMDYLFGWSSFYRKIHDYYYSKKLGLVPFAERIPASGPDPLKFSSKGIQDNLALYEHLLKKFVLLAKANNILPVLAIEERLVCPENNQSERKMIRWEYIPSLKNHAELVELYSRLDGIVSSIAEKENIPLINIQNKIGCKSWFFIDHVHTSPEGSKAIAGEYASLLVGIMKDFTK